MGSAKRTKKNGVASTKTSKQKSERNVQPASLKKHEDEYKRHPILRAMVMITGAILAVVATELSAVFFPPAGESNTSHSRHPGVVLLAHGRSGSSFFSSWFENNDDFLLFIEPCASPYVGNINKGFVGAECGRVLEEIRNCDFRHVQPHKTHLQNTVVEEFKGWGNRSAVDRCPEQTVVIKEIRVGPWGFNSKKRSFSDDAKVVILVRDPRAVMHSRIQHWMRPDADEETSMLDVDIDPIPFSPRQRHGHPYSQSIRSFCYEQVQLLKDAKLLGVSQALVVEYQDILTKPMQSAQRVFDYIGIEMPEQTRDHILKSTNGDCEFKDKAFSTCRQTSSSDTDLKWIEKMAIEDIRHVERECEESLKMLGYPLYDELVALRSGEDWVPL